MFRVDGLGEGGSSAIATTSVLTLSSEPSHPSGTVEWQTRTGLIAIATSPNRPSPWQPESELFTVLGYRWREGAGRPIRNGSVSGTAVPFLAMQFVACGLAHLVHLPAPGQPVPIGESWSVTWAEDLSFALPRSIEGGRVRVRLSTTTTYTMRGWGQLAEQRVAVLDAEGTASGEVTVHVDTGTRSQPLLVHRTAEILQRPTHASASRVSGVSSIAGTPTSGSEEPTNASFVLGRR